MLDQPSLTAALARARPHEVYNLASVSFVPRSWEQPVLTAEFAAVGVTTMLEAVRATDPSIRFYQASSSEIFGAATESPQDEETPLAPVTPYGVAKAYGHFITQSYRRRYGLFACSGILYNHESPRRPLEFVVRKVTHAVARIACGLEDTLELGDLDAQRDWGYARDYARAMALMLRADDPSDYVVSSGVLHSVRDLVEIAFGHVGLEWERYVRTDDRLRRGTSELANLVGNANKAKEQLGWVPTLDFAGLVGLMVDADLALLRSQPAARAGAVG
jgi:GDPmannose 4,6-dehydratase